MSKKLSKLHIAALVLAVSFVAHQSVMMCASATDITGITGVNGVFDINPAKVNGDIGIREYTNFTLSEGDIANLIFKYGAENVSKFVNLVDNQININGLVNTVRDGAFYNGEAIFVSPNGMVVGESGVLNVGSLSVLTPTAPGMNLYKKGQATLEELGYHGNSDITINGKVFSRGNVQMIGRDINVANGAYVMAGVNDNNTSISAKADAEKLFNALVNTGSTNKANIEFRTYNRDGNGSNGMNIQGNVVNNGVGNVILTNRGKGFTAANGSIGALEGDIHLVNGSGVMSLNNTVNAANGSLYVSSGTKSGSVNIGSSSNLSAKELVQIVHSGSGNTTVNGNIKSGNNVYITEKKGNLNVNATINNSNGKIAIAGNGTGLTIDENANINNDNQIRIVNTGANGLTFKGKVTNTGDSGSTAITNRNGNFIVSENAVITNNGSKAKTNLTNTSGKFEYNGTINAGGQELLVQNTGAGGFDVNGTINSSAKTYVQNTNGTLNVTGAVKGNNSALVYLGNTGAGGIKITNNAAVTNNAGKIQIVNTGAGGMTIDAVPASEGAVAGVQATGVGTVAITNRNGVMSIDSTIKTANGNMNLTNVGSRMDVLNNAVVGSTNGGQLTVQNTGANGMNIDGTIANNGSAVVYNKTGNMNIAGKISNKGGKLSVTNVGSTLNVEDGASITNDQRLYITNKGAGGMDIDGTVHSDGHVLLTNRNAGMNINSDVSSNSNVVLTNSGNKDMAVTGTVKGQKITVSGKGADVVLGNIITDQTSLEADKKVVINVENGNLLNAGSEADLIKSNGSFFAHVKNGTIGEDVVSDNAIGSDARDLAKSINVNVQNGVKAFTTGTADKSGVINIASSNADLKVDRIKADGKVMLTTGRDKNILNASTDLANYANVNGTTVQMISGGSVGTADSAIHFRQTDATQESNVLAVKDINLHQRGEVDEAVNFGVIKSKTGNINANMIKNGKVANAVAAGDVNITARKSNSNLEVTNKTNDTGIIKDYFD